MVAMKSVGVRELKANPGKVLRLVRDSNQQIDLTIRGEVVARLVPVKPRLTAEELASGRPRPTTEEMEAVWRRHREIAHEISAVWPRGVSVDEAIAEIRREL